VPVSNFCFADESNARLEVSRPPLLAAAKQAASGVISVCGSAVRCVSVAGVCEALYGG